MTWMPTPRAAVMPKSMKSNALAVSGARFTLLPFLQSMVPHSTRLSVAKLRGSHEFNRYKRRRPQSLLQKAVVTAFGSVL